MANTHNAHTTHKHTQCTHAEPLCDATPEAVAACTAWVMENVKARGTTDIMSPLQRAMRILKVCDTCVSRATVRVRAADGLDWFLDALALLRPAGSCPGRRSPNNTQPCSLSPAAARPGRRARAAVYIPYHGRLR